MNYKDTILVPKTKFKMKANLTQKEGLIRKQWIENDIINQKENNSTNKIFVLHDGPPYSNGALHIGHALNKILKDFIVRYHHYNNYDVQFYCGWDNHGLPIENEVLKKSKIDRKTNPAAFLYQCADYAKKQVLIQQKQLELLGLWTNFDKKYLTMDFDYELTQLNLFNCMVNKNLIYRNEKPVYWSPFSQTALADAEIEYQTLKSDSIYIKFQFYKQETFSKNTYFLVWTTTPWTIPANQLLAVGKDIKYSLVEFKNNFYIIASELINAVFDNYKFDNYKIIRNIKSSELVKYEYIHPLTNKISKVVYGHHVQNNQGTGIVHIASGFGEDDFLIAKENNISVYAPIDDRGCFTDEINDDELKDTFYLKANKLIIDRLKNSDHLLQWKEIVHSTTVDWRTKKPVIYRATKQWFVNINKIKKDLLNNLNNTEWSDPKNAKKMQEMIEKRNDWCISRQRLWGIPLIIFYDDKNQAILDTEIITYAINKIKSEKSVLVWFKKETDFFLPKKYQGLNWTKETDIMDVWFDSGTSNLVLNKTWSNKKCDLVIEGNDQFRGWFNSSLITSTIDHNDTPFKRIAVHGFVNDKNGFKMSKSKGNIVNLSDFIKTNGADILRLWVASVDYTNDVRIGDNIVDQIKELYRKIRNTVRFLIANTSDFDYKKNGQSNLAAVDNYIIHQLLENEKLINKAYKDLNFSKIIKIIKKLITNQLSNFYFDFSKDILYLKHYNNLRRRQIQTVLYFCLHKINDFIKPILVHTAEEIYQNSFPNETKLQSIHLKKNYQLPKITQNNDILLIKQFLQLRQDFNKALEFAKTNQIVNKSLESKVIIKLKSDYSHLEKINDFKKMLIVSQIDFNDNLMDATEYDTSWIKIIKADGQKCERCWSYYDNLNIDQICDDCLIEVNKF